MALDLETTGLHPVRGARIRLCSINTGKGVYVIDVFKTNGLGPVASALAESKGVKIGHNLAFDQMFFLFEYGVELWPIFDSFRSSALMHNGREMGHNLWDCYDRYLNQAPLVDDYGASDWTGELSTEQLDYAADDVIFLPKLRDALKPQLASLGLNRVALIEFGVILPEAAVRLNGFYLNSESWMKVYADNKVVRDKLELELWNELPNPSEQELLPGMPPPMRDPRAVVKRSKGKKAPTQFNLDSPQQMLASLLKLGVRVRDPQTRKYKYIEETDEMTLAMAVKEFPIIAKVLEFRGYAQACKTFGPDFLKDIVASTGRIHPDYFGLLRAGRYSCSHPNLANIPRGAAFRACFQAEPGYKLGIADYCVAEGTRIALDRGLVPVEQVRVGDFAIVEDGSRHRIDRVFDRGVRPTLTLKTKLGYELRATAEHRIRIQDSLGQYSWKRIEDIQEGDWVAVQAGWPGLSEALSLPRTIRDGVYFDQVTAKESSGTSHVYDLSVPGPTTYISDGLISHNCGIEMRIVAELSGDKTLLAVFEKTPPYDDIHITTASVMTGRSYDDILQDPNKKKIKQSAKPVNFGFCIAEGQRVLTHVGLLPIEDVRCWHKVWDGLEWVTHDGLLYKGVKEVVTYDGLTATPDHEVFTYDGAKVPFAEAMGGSRRLAVGGVEGVPIRYDAFDREDGETGTQSSVRGGYLRCMLQEPVALGRQHQGQEDHQLHVSGQIQRPSFGDLGGSLRRYGSALLSGLARLVASVQGAWDSSALQIAGALHPMGVGEVAFGAFRGYGFGSREQQRPLLSSKPSFGDSNHQFAQPRLRRARVYDLMNAGPRHRFTVEGRVVSNCYGMMPAKLVLYAQSNYGVTMSIDEATEYREKYFQAYKGVARWHREAARAAEKSGIVRTLGGRLRYLTPEEFNQVYNTPSQGTGADGLKTALRLVYFRMKKLIGHLPVRTLLRPDPDTKMVHHVYDEIVAETKDKDDLPKRVLTEIKDGMQEGMEQFLSKVKAPADGNSGDNWAEK